MHYSLGLAPLLLSLVLVGCDSSPDTASLDTSSAKGRFFLQGIRDTNVVFMDDSFKQEATDLKREHDTVMRLINDPSQLPYFDRSELSPDVRDVVDQFSDTLDALGKAWQQQVREDAASVYHQLEQVELERLELQLQHDNLLPFLESELAELDRLNQKVAAIQLNLERSATRVRDAINKDITELNLPVYLFKNPVRIKIVEGQQGCESSGKILAVVQQNDCKHIELPHASMIGKPNNDVIIAELPAIQKNRYQLNGHDDALLAQRRQAADKLHGRVLKVEETEGQNFEQIVAKLGALETKKRMLNLQVEKYDTELRKHRFETLYVKNLADETTKEIEKLFSNRAGKTIEQHKHKQQSVNLNEPFDLLNKAKLFFVTTEKEDTGFYLKAISTTGREEDNIEIAPEQWARSFSKEELNWKMIEQAAAL